MPEMRTPFLDDISAAGETQTARARRQTCGRRIMTKSFVLEGEIDDDVDDDEDDFSDTDEDDDEDDDDDNEEDDVETWQVHTAAQISAKARPWLDFRF